MQRAGIEAAKDRGVYQGRQPGTFKGQPRRAQRLREKGLTQVEIAEALGVSRRTVIRLAEASIHFTVRSAFTPKRDHVSLPTIPRSHRN